MGLYYLRKLTEPGISERLNVPEIASAGSSEQSI
jgi:hypothetical protein